MIFSKWVPTRKNILYKPSPTYNGMLPFQNFGETLICIDERLIRDFLISVNQFSKIIYHLDPLMLHLFGRSI